MPKPAQPDRKYVITLSIEMSLKATKKVMAAEVKHAIENSYAFAGSKVRVRTVDVD